MRQIIMKKLLALGGIEVVVFSFLFVGIMHLGLEGMPLVLTLVTSVSVLLFVLTGFLLKTEGDSLGDFSRQNVLKSMLLSTGVSSVAIGIASFIALRTAINPEANTFFGDTYPATIVGVFSLPVTFLCSFLALRFFKQRGTKVSN